MSPDTPDPATGPTTITDVVGGVTEAPLVGSSNTSSGVTGTGAGHPGVVGNSVAAAEPAAAAAGHPPSPTSDGVLGLGLTGVHGKSVTPSGSGVMGEHSSNGLGVHGISATSDGVHGVNGAESGIVSTQGCGVCGQSQSGYGVYGASRASDGLHGVNGSESGSAPGAGCGVNGQSENGYGVYGASRTAVGVYGVGPTAGHFQGNVTIAGSLSVTGDIEVTGDVKLTAPGSDVAEHFECTAASSVEAGTVLVIASDGTLQTSAKKYDKCVAGVVSGGGTFRPGIVLGDDSRNSHTAVVALVGRVHCKVDANAAAISVGDLLTTSGLPGHAMKVVDPVQGAGAIIGKALGSLQSGTGTLPILVSLQ